MIIVSQDKDSIVNFDRVHELWIDDNLLDKTECEYEILADDELLGCYKTEERAQGVLQSIIIMINSNSDVYEMPEE